MRRTILLTALAWVLAAALDLDDATRSSLFYALLLKDAGCSSNAARVVNPSASYTRIAEWFSASTWSIGVSPRASIPAATARMSRVARPRLRASTSTTWPQR